MCFETLIERRQFVRQPRNRIRGISQRGRAGAGGNNLAIFFEDHAYQPEIDTVDLSYRAAHYDSAARGIVRTVSGQFDLPVSYSTIDYFQNRNDVFRGRQDLRRRDAWSP